MKYKLLLVGSFSHMWQCTVQCGWHMDVEMTLLIHPSCRLSLGVVVVLQTMVMQYVRPVMLCTAVPLPDTPAEFRQSSVGVLLQSVPSVHPGSMRRRILKGVS